MMYETENILAEKKIIYQKWEIPQIGFYWLIAELGRKENLVFGYANLNDDAFAEWGYISLDEMTENNVTKCHSWQPCTFEEAQKKMQKYGGVKSQMTFTMDILSLRKARLSERQEGTILIPSSGYHAL